MVRRMVSLFLVAVLLAAAVPGRAANNPDALIGNGRIMGIDYSRVYMYDRFPIKLYLEPLEFRGELRREGDISINEINDIAMDTMRDMGLSSSKLLSCESAMNMIQNWQWGAGFELLMALTEFIPGNSSTIASDFFSFKMGEEANAANLVKTALNEAVDTMKDELQTKVLISQAEAAAKGLKGAGRVVKAGSRYAPVVGQILSGCYVLDSWKGTFDKYKYLLEEAEGKLKVEADFYGELNKRLEKRYADTSEGSGWVISFDGATDTHSGVLLWGVTGVSTKWTVSGELRPGDPKSVTGLYKGNLNINVSDIKGFDENFFSSVDSPMLRRHIDGVNVAINAQIGSKQRLTDQTTSPATLDKLVTMEYEVFVAKKSNTDPDFTVNSTRQVYEEETFNFWHELVGGSFWSGPYGTYTTMSVVESINAKDEKVSTMIITVDEAYDEVGGHGQVFKTELFSDDHGPWIIGMPIGNIWKPLDVHPVIMPDS